MRSLGYLIFLLICSCTTLQPLSPANNQTLSWSERAQQLTTISKWTLQGVAGIRTAKNAWTASLFWQQQKSAYQLHLFGPLGMNRIQLAGNAEQVTLSTSSQAPITAQDAQSLLQQQLGWKLPVNHLQYWIRGIPAPDKKAKLTKDNFNHLLTLQQDGWEINYQQYSNIDGIDLPTRLNLTNPQIQLRLVIKQWQL